MEPNVYHEKSFTTSRHCRNRSGLFVGLLVRILCRLSHALVGMDAFSAPQDQVGDPDRNILTSWSRLIAGANYRRRTGSIWYFCPLGKPFDDLLSFNLMNKHNFFCGIISLVTIAPRIIISTLHIAFPSIRYFVQILVHPIVKLTPIAWSIRDSIGLVQIVVNESVFLSMKPDSV